MSISSTAHLIDKRAKRALLQTIIAQCSLMNISTMTVAIITARLHFPRAKETGIVSFVTSSRAHRQMLADELRRQPSLLNVSTTTMQRLPSDEGLAGEVAGAPTCSARRVRGSKAARDEALRKYGDVVA